MNTALLLTELRKQDVEIAVDGDRLCVRAPKGVLTTELRELLALNRAEIIRILQAERPVSRPSAPAPVKQAVDTESQSGLLHRNEQAAPSGSEAATSPRVIAGRNVKQLYFEDARQSCFQDTDGHFWIYDLATDHLTGLVTGQGNPEGPIPAQVWGDFGRLVAMMALEKLGRRQGCELSPDAQTPRGGLPTPENKQDSAASKRRTRDSRP